MTFPHLRLSAGQHDRAGARRRDEAWLADRWADPTTRVLVVRGTRVRPHAGRLAWVGPEAAPDGLRVLLGEHDGHTWFAVVVDPEAGTAADLGGGTASDQTGQAAGDQAGEWVPLRGLLPHLADGTLEEAPLVLHALGLAEWLHATRFCPRCGGTLAARSAGHELVCGSCGRSQFPRTDPAVIMLVTSGPAGAEEERCLLGRGTSWPEARYSTLAGFCEPGETLEDAVRREVLEETGVTVGEVSYFGNQPWPLPASLMLAFTGTATTTEITTDPAELADARWLTRAEMRAEAGAGRLLLPAGVSISRSLIEAWYGGPLPGRW